MGERTLPPALPSLDVPESSPGLNLWMTHDGDLIEYEQIAGLKAGQELR